MVWCRFSCTNTIAEVLLDKNLSVRDRKYGILQSELHGVGFGVFTNLYRCVEQRFIK